MAPTLFLQPDDLGVGAEAVPRRAVVDGLEVGRHDVAHGQRGDDALLRGHRLHRVAARRARLQHRLLPRPGLRREEEMMKTQVKEEELFQRMSVDVCGCLKQRLKG